MMQDTTATRLLFEPASSTATVVASVAGRVTGSSNSPKTIKTNFWIQSLALVFGTIGLRFKFRAGQIGYTVANASFLYCCYFVKDLKVLS